ALPLRDLEDRVDRFLFRSVDEAARVDDDDVGLVEVVRDRDVGVTLKLSKHDLGIDEILRAAEGDHADALGRLFGRNYTHGPISNRSTAPAVPGEVWGAGASPARGGEAPPPHSHYFNVRSNSANTLLYSSAQLVGSTEL